MRGHKERLQLTDTVLDVFTKLAEGNFGAAAVLKQMMEKGKDIDPDCGGGEPIFMMMYLDTYGIYGARLWMLYKDVAGQNLSKAWACVRATQLGFISDTQLDHAIDNRGDGLDLNEVCAKVKERLPNFQVTE